MTFDHAATARRLSPTRLLAVVTGLVMLLAVALVLSNRLSAVTLLTDPTPPGEFVGCYTSGIDGPLVVDAVYGTAVTQHGTVAGVPQEWSYPVQWPYGYTGRRTPGVEVLDRRGNVWARTGTNVSMMGGYDGENPRYWVACGWIKTY